jgi:hypothetical protein
VAGTVLNLDQFETRQLLELESRGPGTYEVQMMIRGNSLLSSVFVKSISAGATLKVNYFDTSSGTVQDSERYDLQSHILLTDADAGTTNRIIVPRIHNKPIAEVIVTGGTVEFGVYITVVADFPSEVIFDENTVIPVQGSVKLEGNSDGTKIGNVGDALKVTFSTTQIDAILNSVDRILTITYADFGTRNQRVTKLIYSSPSIPGEEAHKTLAYTLVGNRYRRDSITWSLENV